MAVVYVCRHGQDEDNLMGILNGRRDRPLTGLGREQATVVGDRLRRSGVVYHAILTSPLRRAEETARIIGSALGVPVTQEEELVERDFGILTGKPISEIKTYAGDNVFQGDKVLYFLSVKDAETFEDCYKRAASVLQRVDAAFAGKNVLLVCHGDIGKMLQAVRKNISWEEGLRIPYFANTEVVKL
ncbi:phosphoglycerate mutase protein [Trypanosoma theileri]|uniref:Phosphoglycerate mutase protein n=1 Tax=Trypanosoma theileri TaxID=67003 RepID=A0A1X0NP76_9TRYP|nr:phosphoglycerate mutase protein [Trypanosoma theileri]ORC86411.1 phosphoglycerate mutase protein [Trypanosoma theileri]